MTIARVCVRVADKTAATLKATTLTAITLPVKR